MAPRPGQEHLRIYDLNGKLIRRLTPANLIVNRLVDVDESHGWIYFSARDKASTSADVHLYRARMSGHGLHRLTNVPGQHDPPPFFGQINPLHQIRLSPSKGLFIDTYSTPTQRPTVELRRTDGRLLRTLIGVERISEPWWNAPEEFALTGPDGVRLEGILYRPFDFDPARRYPVVAYVIGLRGTLPRHFESNPLARSAQALAQLGYLTIVLERAQTRKAAERGFGDHVVDESRHAGNEVMIGPPAANPAGYEFASNIPLAGNLQGHLLLIHGTHDTAVPLSHTMRLADALIKADKPFDLLVMPGETHSTEEIWSGYGDRAAIRYFREHLPPTVP